MFMADKDYRLAKLTLVVAAFCGLAAGIYIGIKEGFQEGVFSAGIVWIVFGGIEGLILYISERGKELPEDVNFVSVFIPRDSVQSGIIKSTLEEQGVRCYVNNDAVSTTRFGGTGIGAGEMKVMVPESQAEEAREIIAELGIE